MKVLIVHNRHRATTASGEDRAVDQDHSALMDAGHEVRMLVRCSDEIAHLSFARKALLPGVAVWSRRSMRALDAVLAEFDPDVVHVHNVVPLLSASILAGCERARVPCVVTLHNYQLLCLSGSLFRAGEECRLCEQRLLSVPGIVHGCYRDSRLASAGRSVATVVARRYWRSVPSAYIFLSEAHCRAFEPLGLPSGRCFVKANSVPRSPRGAPDGSVLYLGRLSELKGVRVLMRAWDHYEASERPPRLRLVIAGAGPLESEVRAWSRSRSSVEVVGLVARDVAADLVRRATTVVVPSEWREPFGLVVAEAMAAGVVPITTARGSFEELITDGVDGLLYPPGDAGSLAALLRKVAEDPAWVGRLGSAAQHTYERRFSPTRIVSELESIYRLAVERPRWMGTPEPDASPSASNGASGGPPWRGAADAERADPEPTAALWHEDRGPSPQPGAGHPRARTP